MALCPTCFNAPDWCECDPPFDGTGGVEPTKKWTPVRRATVEDIESAVQDLPEARKPLLRDILTVLVDARCWIEDPPARVRDYVNIRVPATFGEARLASMNRSTGRIEFHDGSFDVARRAGVADRFDEVPSSNAAAITVDDEGDRDAAVRLAEAFLALRRTSG